MKRNGFTLVELMITISVIAILSGVVIFALFSAQETAKAAKTRSIIAKLNGVIAARYEGYMTRRLPIEVRRAEHYTDVNNNGRWDTGEPYDDINGDNTWSPAATLYQASKLRLDALRETMRIELPDRYSDIYDNPVSPSTIETNAPKIPEPALHQAYRNAVTSTSTGEYQSAECLYLIVMLSSSDEYAERPHFADGDIGDTDNDGMKEFLDGWKRPIRFLRWAPGFTSELQPHSEPFDDQPHNPEPKNRMRDSDESYTDLNKNGKYDVYLDPFDLSQVYQAEDSQRPSFPLTPLIYSAGPDGLYGIVGEYDTGGSGGFQYSTTTPPNDPFFKPPSGTKQIGEFDEPKGFASWLDNLTNHDGLRK